jgi:hypothetical protein
LKSNKKFNLSLQIISFLWKPSNEEGNGYSFGISETLKREKKFKELYTMGLKASLIIHGTVMPT